jgi:4-amino-4-deoxy-L-arabinose transferase-like glycosyltransferase
MSRRASLLATFLLAFENQTFLFSGMAMLEVSSLTFTLAAFWLYLRGNYPASGIMVALSALAKLNGALAIIAILLHWLIVRRDRIWQFIVLVVSAPVFFVGLMPLADFYPFHGWVNPLERIITMLKGSASLTFANVSGTYPEKPIEWIFRWDLTPYYFHPNYLAVVSYTVEFLIIPILIYMLIRAPGLQSNVWLAIIRLPKKIWLFMKTLPGRFRLIRAKPLEGLELSQTHVEAPELSQTYTVKLETSRAHSDAGIFGLCWFAATYLVWIPAVWITDRVTYPYYIYPTIGAICIGLGMGLAQLIHLFEARQSGKLKWAAISIVVIFLLAHLAFFALVSPLSYWWGTPIFRGLQS